MDKFKFRAVKILCSILTGISFMCGYAIIKVLGVFFIQIQASFSATAASVSFTLGLPMSVAFLGGPVYSAIFNAVGIRLTYLLAGLFMGSGFCSTYLATQILHVQISLGLFGVGAGLVNISTLTVVGRCFSSTRAVAMGVIATGGALCAAVGTPILQHLIDEYGWQGAMLMLGGFTFNIIPCGMGIYHTDGIIQRHKEEIKRNKSFDMMKRKNESFTDFSSKYDEVFPQNQSFISNGSMHRDESFIVKNRSDVAPHNNNIDIQKIQSRRKSFRRRASSVGSQMGNLLDVSLLKDVLFVCYCVVVGITICARLTSALYLVRFAQSVGMDDHTAVGLVSIMEITNFVMCPTISLLTNLRFTKEATCGRMSCTLSNPKRSYVLALFQLSMGGILWLPTFLHEYSGFVVYAVLMGLCYGGLTPLPNIVIIDLFGTSKLAGAMGYRSLATGISILTIPAFTGYLIDLYGTYNIAQYVTSALSITAGIWLLVIQLLLLKRDRKKNRKENTKQEF